MIIYKLSENKSKLGHLLRILCLIFFSKRTVWVFVFSNSKACGIIFWMNFDMILHIAWWATSVVTFRAGKWLCFAGSFFMFPQMPWLSKCLATTYVTGFVFECVLLWVFKWILWLNVLSHSLQLNGLTSLWVILCLPKELLSLNFFPQVEQL